MKAGMKIVKIVGIIVILAVIICLAVGILPSYISSQKNYKLMKKYISDTYGDDYDIVEKSLGTIGASGRNNDYVRVKQHGITYVVYALDGEIMEDTYMENYAGKIVCDYIMEQLNKNDVELPNFDNRDILISGTVTANTYPTTIKSYDDVKKMGGSVWITINIKDSTDYKQEKWLYDVYCLFKDEFSNFTIHITAGVDYTNSGTVYTMDYQSGYGDDIADIDAFWDRFH